VNTLASMEQPYNVGDPSCKTGCPACLPSLSMNQNPACCMMASLVAAPPAQMGCMNSTAGRKRCWSEGPEALERQARQDAACWEH
jgi:hypothetical protein